MATEPIPVPEPGVYPDTPQETYRAWDAFSQSMVRPMLKSGAHLQAYLAKPLDTKALRIGSLTDTLVFEPDMLPERFSFRPATYQNDKGQVKPWNANSKVCKETLKALAVAGKPIVSPHELAEAKVLAAAARAHPRAQELLAEGQAQVAMVWQDKETGVMCKGLIDWLEAKALNDLKTSKDASKEGFPWSMNTFGYDIQGAFYVDGYEALTRRRLPFRLIVVEKPDFWPDGIEWPVHVFDSNDPDTFAVGRKRYKRALFSYRVCKESGEWPAYSHFIEPISLPMSVIRAELGQETSDAGF